ncbi:hypothetical protein L249_2960 [Ophiocordyceps polyrhachis-furcata BCC 54312]|uniref:AB hydrolase-1 domain-containing protein n=1 Tax=Ophiocordyceps polyrhachis-furcata BCC 54312 TaxID=1330021 RepID=A0A367LQJ1_9HYPO|nr:hypothetical protein L249_2960 [Ophiocordyceps polyrhachis-furcata BCC 54312]
MASSSDAPFSVLVHPYRSPTRGACAYETGNTSARNAVIFIGGLGDGPHTTPYIRTVSKRLEKANHLSYSVFEIRLRSAFTGFGTASLKDDIEDIAALVKHLRHLGREKIVLFGHSTGCQDCMQYAHSDSPPVDGFILQAPVSDRESLDLFSPDYQTTLDLASNWIAQGKADDCLPRSMVPSTLGAPVSAYRLHSLWAKGGDDDYFSSDLDGETVARFWSRFTKPVLVLHSERDEFVTPNIDQAALNARYRKANPLVSCLSGLIPGTGHTVLEDEARQWLARRVEEFLSTLKE